jgi:hypothetical protein
MRNSSLPKKTIRHDDNENNDDHNNGFDYFAVKKDAVLEMDVVGWKNYDQETRLLCKVFFELKVTGTLGFVPSNVDRSKWYFGDTGDASFLINPLTYPSSREGSCLRFEISYTA